MKQSYLPALDIPGSIMFVIYVVALFEFKFPYTFLAKYVILSFIITAATVLQNNILVSQAAAIFGFSAVLVIVIQMILKLFNSPA
jgi:hypothetical protein